MNHSFGLRQSDSITICHVLSKYPEVQQAYIFGSRAKGNYKNGSDVDIALKRELLTQHITNQISYELNEETNMPYQFDVLNYLAITEPALTDHINRIGKVFYEIDNHKILNFT